MFKNPVMKPSVVLSFALALMASGAVSARAEEADTHPWYVSLSGGVIDFEGDDPVGDSGLVAVRLGHDYSEAWSFEGALEYAPQLSEQWRTDWRTRQRISRLEEKAGPGVHDTYSLRLTADALRHMTRWEKLDPFLAIGAGVVWYADDFGDALEVLGQAGAGCFYHLNDEWALRTDFRAILVANDSEANSTYTVGLSWTPGAGVPPALPPAVKPGGAPLDSDRDGIPDSEETGTYHTDPMNMDSDWDALSDGDEIRKHGTDPLKRDTDGGGVYDGHEVIEDGTRPTNKPDDLQFFELRLMFDPGDWKIKSEYFSEIGVIGKILKDDPAATARVEGHIDRNTQPSQRKAVRLTERRAEAVRDCLMENWNIARGRLTPAGYGFKRPKGPSDPQKGNIENERIEIYIRRPAPKAL